MKNKLKKYIKPIRLYYKKYNIAVITSACLISFFLLTFAVIKIDQLMISTDKYKVISHKNMGNMG